MELTSAETPIAGPAQRDRGRLRVLVAGGGVAALEVLLALRELAGRRVEVTLLSPDREFVYRPVTVAEAFGRGEARSYPLARSPPTSTRSWFGIRSNEWTRGAGSPSPVAATRSSSTGWWSRPAGSPRSRCPEH